MNRARYETQVLPARAKHLPLGTRGGSESGVFPAVHAPEGVAANDGTQGVDSTAVLAFPSRMRSPEKVAVHAEAVEIINACVELHRLSNAALGAMINEPEKEAWKIRIGAKLWTKAHDIRAARRCPAFYEDLDKRTRGAR